MTLNLRNSAAHFSAAQAQDEQFVTELQRKVNPEYTAKALIRQAVDNARSTGNDIVRTLIEEVGLPAWMMPLAKLMHYSTLETWAQYLKRGQLKAGLNLAEVQMLMTVKGYISEELMTPPTKEETKNLQFQSTIQTAVLRKSENPEKSRNPNFCTEKGSWDAPGYDGNDPDEDYHEKLWVFPTRIVQWPTKAEIVTIQEIKDIYNKKMRQGDASGIPIRQLQYEARGWIQSYRPMLGKTIDYPDKDRRNAIEFFKRLEIRKLYAIAQASKKSQDAAKELRRMAWKYLGKLGRVKIEDQTLEQRIEKQIRRKHNNKKNRLEGKGYLPPYATGALLEDRLHEYVNMLVSKNPMLNPELPWVVEVYFDGEALHDKAGDHEMTPGKGILVNRHVDSK